MTAGVRWLVRAALVAAIAASVTLGSAAAASAASADREGHGRGVPDSKISVQLWTFAEYIGFDTDPATIERTEEVFRRLQRDGLSQRRAVHAERPEREGVPGAASTSTA